MPKKPDSMPKPKYSPPTRSDTHMAERQNKGAVNLLGQVSKPRPAKPPLVPTKNKPKPKY